MNTALFSDLEAFVVLFHQQMLSLQIGEADPGGRSFTECSADKFLTRQGLPFSGIESPTSPYISEETNKRDCLRRYLWFFALLGECAGYC